MNRVIGIATAAIVLVAAAVVGRASASGQSDVIAACAAKDGGLRRVTGGEGCRPSESPLQWNVTGPAGPQGVPGVSGHEVVALTRDVAPGMNEVVVTCPGEKVVTGGGEENRTHARADEAGRSVTPDNLRIRGSRPDGTTAWKVIVHNNGTLDGRIDVYALCANAN